MQAGRNWLSYGWRTGLITIKDIDHMYSIIDSDLTDEDKAIKLYYYCNLSSLKKSSEIYHDLKLEQAQKIDRLIDIYKEYKKRGLFVYTKNPYKCTIDEVVLRIYKINYVYEAIKSESGDYIKAYKLLSAFKNAADFRKSYALFIKFGKKDETISDAREALDHFDEIYNKYKEYESNGIFDDVKKLQEHFDAFKYFDYSKFVIEQYINASDSYKENKFLSDLGIDKGVLNFCALIIDEYDVDLYKRYIEKKEQNTKIRYIRNTETIRDLASGIRTGKLGNGTDFNIFEFTKRVPFKKDNFVTSIYNFMKTNNPDDCNIVYSYIKKNRLDYAGAFNTFNTKEIYGSKTIVNGVEITDHDNDIIIDYLKVNDIPLIYKNYLLARKMYLNGEITEEMVKTKKIYYEPKEKKIALLIPCKK